jgi:uncharacterized protein YjiS (DUF1127 family)
MTTKTHGPRATTLGRSLIGQIATWRARSTARRELIAMDERMLKDIGLSPSVAYAEAAKPFWRG